MAILMCRPDHFGVEYEINPWMHVEVRVNHVLATEQWRALQRTYSGLGVEMTYAEPQRGLPDMVFTANAAVVWGGKAVLSNFHHPQRQGEERHWRVFLEACGFDLRELPRSLCFEGAGDALFLGAKLFCGAGFRTDREAHAVVAEILGVEHVSLDLVDPRFYHLDTCFCPLDSETALCALDAFSEGSKRLIQEQVPNLIPVPAHIAAQFACNAMPVGRTVVSSVSIGALQQPLAAAGFDAVGVSMTEFMKSGGGVRCLTLPLDAGRSGSTA
jgi:N-dimethylarginine dimethylaminohydrolase